jgi:hypothetical protein
MIRGSWLSLAFTWNSEHRSSERQRLARRVHSASTSVPTPATVQPCRQSTTGRQLDIYNSCHAARKHSPRVVEIQVCLLVTNLKKRNSPVQRPASNGDGETLLTKLSKARNRLVALLGVSIVSHCTCFMIAVSLNGLATVNGPSSSPPPEWYSAIGQVLPRRSNKAERTRRPLFHLQFIAETLEWLLMKHRNLTDRTRQG